MSGLGLRLRRLRNRARERDNTGATGPELRQRLQRLAPARVAPTATHTQGAAHGLAASLGGMALAPGLVEITDRLGDDPSAGCHGGEVPELHFHAPPARWSQFLFLDTETTGLAGGTGTVAFMVGTARVGPRGIETHQYLLSGFAGEPAMLSRLQARFRPDDVLVTYNGASFDLPLLQSRYRLNRLPWPMDGLEHLDLLPAVRRAFARRWCDCRLSTAEAALLKLRRRDDLPGSEAPIMWQRWLRDGCPRGLAAVLRHNRQDLLSLARLLPRLADAYRQPRPHQADPCALTWMLLRDGRHREAMDHLRRHRDLLDERGSLLLASLARRLREWSLARDIWEDLAARGEGAALEALAKYHEHVTGDFATALDYTEALSDVQPKRAEHLQRRLRLLRRLERDTGAPGKTGAL